MSSGSIGISIKHQNKNMSNEYIDETRLKYYEEKKQKYGFEFYNDNSPAIIIDCSLFQNNNDDNNNINNQISATKISENEKENSNIISNLKNSYSRFSQREIKKKLKKILGPNNSIISKQVITKF